MPSTAKDRRRRKKFVDQYFRMYGGLCLGHKRYAHYVAYKDLTADHIVPQADGGVDGDLQVLCRSCNSSRGRGPLAEPLLPPPPAIEWPSPFQR